MRGYECIASGKGDVDRRFWVFREVGRMDGWIWKIE